eukprot:266878-Prorocentrum_minimum.AAC.1
MARTPRRRSSSTSRVSGVLSAPLPLSTQEEPWGPLLTRYRPPTEPLPTAPASARFRPATQVQGEGRTPRVPESRPNP